MKKNKKDKRTLRERFSEAARSLKGREKKMPNEEAERSTAEQAEEAQAEKTAETVETAAAAEAAETAEEEAAGAEVSCEELEALKKSLAEAEQKRDEYLAAAQRSKADFINLKRRTENARSEAYDEGRRDAIGELLPVVDNLERALEAAGEDSSPLKDGVQMVLRQTNEALKKLGVSAIDPKGDPFDANEMNAVMQGTEEEGEPGTVCQVLQKGYKLGNRVIRHAMVKVVAG